MKTWERNVFEDCDISQGWYRVRSPASRPGHLHLVTAHDLQNLANVLAKGYLPRDFEAKLNRLAQGDLGNHFIEQTSRTMIALLQAAQDGSFKEASRAEGERLLRVLAYVRKDDDAIPDYRPDGFSDDQQEVRAVTTELSSLLQAFKAWRLRYQVPGMWLRKPLGRLERRRRSDDCLQGWQSEDTFTITSFHPLWQDWEVVDSHLSKPGWLRSPGLSRP